MSMTFQEALASGWTMAGTSWARGYVSRRVDPMKQPLHMAGGRRLGSFYVDLPSSITTQYHVRQYLTPPADLIPEILSYTEE